MNRVMHAEMKRAVGSSDPMAAASLWTVSGRMDRTEEIVREQMAWTTKDPGRPAVDRKAGQGGG